MGSNTWKKVNANMKLAFIGLVLGIKGEALNIVDAQQLNAATAHEAIQSTGTQFAMVDTGEAISIRNRAGFEVLSLPGTEEYRDFYGDNIMTRDEYLIKGGKFLDIRRAVVNGNNFFKNTFDTETGKMIGYEKIEHLEDDINNNMTLSLEELIDLTKTLSGDSIVELPGDLKGKLSYYDMDTGELVTGSPADVLSGALQSVGFEKEEIDQLFEGTALEDPEKKEARIKKLEDTDELTADSKLNVVFLDAVTVDGELDLEHAEEMKPADISQMLIDKYQTLVKGYLDADERVGEFTSMLAGYFRDTSEEEQAKKIATLVSIFDATDKDELTKASKRLGRRIEKLWAEDGVQFKQGEGTKFDQYDRKVGEILEEKYDEWADKQDKLDRLNNSFEEASAYADDCISKGKIGPTSYELTIQMKEKEIFEACGGVTEEEVEAISSEVDKLEKNRRKMEDYRFLSFVVEDCEYEVSKKHEKETAEINASYLIEDDEDLSNTVGAIAEINGLFAGEDDVKISAASIPVDYSVFYDGTESEIVSSDELDKIELADPEVEIDEDSDIKIYNKEDLGFEF